MDHQREENTTIKTFPGHWAHVTGVPKARSLQTPSNPATAVTGDVIKAFCPGCCYVLRFRYPFPRTGQQTSQPSCLCASTAHALQTAPQEDRKSKAATITKQLEGL